MRGNGAGGDGVHANSAIAPFDGETAGESFDSGFRDGGGNDVSRTDRGVSCRDAENGAFAVGFEPAASASHGGVQSAEQHDADHGFESARRKFFGTGDEISGSVVNENVEWTGLPDGIDHGFDGVEIADVARESMDGAFGGGGKFGSGLLQHVLTTAADVDRGAEFEEAVSHGFAESGAAAGDEDAFFL